MPDFGLQDAADDIVLKRSDEEDRILKKIFCNFIDILAKYTKYSG